MNEAEKIRKDEERELEAELKKVSLKKMKKELHEIEKNYWSRYVFPEIPKWIPAILIAAVSLFITFKTNLFKTEADKAKIEQEKLTMQMQKGLIQDTIAHLLNDKNILNSFVSTLQNDTLLLRQKVYSTQRKIDSLNAALQIETSNKNNVKNEINILEKEKIKLLSEIRFAPLSAKLTIIKNYPNVNNEEVEEIVKYLKEEGEFKYRLLDSIFTFKNDKRLYPISTYLLYRNKSSEENFKLILDIVGQMISKYRERSDIYNYEMIDSAEYESQKSLFSIIGDIRWRNERKLSISKLIIDSLYNHYVDNNIYNSLIAIPRNFKQNKDWDFDLFKLDPSSFFKYIRLNLYLAYANETVSGYNFKGDTIRSTVTVGEAGYDVGNTEYFYNRTKQKKIDFFINASMFCPQIYYSFKIKYSNFYFNNSINEVNTTSPQWLLWGNINEAKTLFNYPLLKQAIDSIDGTTSNNDLSAASDISDSIELLVKSKKGLMMSELIEKAGKAVKEIYNSNEFMIEAWLDKDFKYLKKNPQLLANKLITFSL